MQSCLVFTVRDRGQSRYIVAGASQIYQSNTWCLDYSFFWNSLFATLLIIIEVTLGVFALALRLVLS